MAQQATVRDTSARRAIAKLVARESGHFTAADLLTAAGRSGTRVGRATVFRTLDLLSEQGALERIDLPSGEHAYVACDPGERHHHHLVCRQCGQSVEVTDSGLRQSIDRIASQTGFRIENHRLELYGICSTCLSNH